MKNKNLPRDLTFEQFKALAEQEPDMDVECVYELECYEIADSARPLYPKFRIMRYPAKFMFRTQEDAETYMRRLVSGDMEEYRTFYVNGYVYIEYIDNPAVPESVNEKFANLCPHTVTYACDGSVEDCLRSTKEVTENFDWRYIEHPEDYKPACRAFDQFITDGTRYGHFTIDDLMLVKPEDLYAHVRIDI